MIHLATTLQSLHGHICGVTKDDGRDEHAGGELQQRITDDKDAEATDKACLGDANLALDLEHHWILTEGLIELLLIRSQDGLRGFGESHRERVWLLTGRLGENKVGPGQKRTFDPSLACSMRITTIFRLLVLFMLVDAELPKERVEKALKKANTLTDKHRK